MDLREARAERRVVAAAAFVDPVEHEHVVGDAEHLRHAQRARLREPAQARRLGRVLAGRDVPARLDEAEGLVRELHAEGLVDVAAADALQRSHLATGGGAHERGQAHRGRSSSSRPRQAASTWSSTFSKPSGPP